MSGYTVETATPQLDLCSVKFNCSVPKGKERETQEGSSLCRLFDEALLFCCCTTRQETCFSLFTEVNSTKLHTTVHGEQRAGAALG